MKEIPITLQMQDPDGNVVEEKNLVVSKEDCLIWQFADTKLWLGFLRLPDDERKRVFGQFSNAIKKGGGTIVSPPGAEIRVLHKDGSAV